MDRPNILAKLRTDIAGLKESKANAKKPEDERVMRRAATGVVIAAYESGEDALLVKQSELAYMYFELASELSPQFPWPYFGMARASAQQGKKKEALAALSHALENGYQPAEVAALLAQDPDLARWKDDEDFRKLAAPAGAHLQ